MNVMAAKVLISLPTFSMETKPVPLELQAAFSICMFKVQYRLVLSDVLNAVVLKLQSIILME
jgi:hypothetical protein